MAMKDDEDNDILHPLQPINIMNEKIFVFVWFWLVILSGVTVVSLFYHVFVMMTPAITKVGKRLGSILSD